MKWRCPRCGSLALATPPWFGAALRCDACAAVVRREEAVCPLCDGADALRPRDSVHVECRGCGERQSMFAAPG